MRKSTVALGGLVLLSLMQDSKAAVRGAAAFKLSLTGSNVQAQVILNPGVKPPTGKVNDKIVKDVLQGTLDDFASNFVTVDPGQSGSFYFFYISKDEWRVADNPDGLNATVLTGKVDNVGNAIMFGEYHFIPQTPFTNPMFRVCAAGKVKFKPGTFDPIGASGTVYLSSTITGDNMTLKFKTVGGPL